VLNQLPKRDRSATEFSSLGTAEAGRTPRPNIATAAILCAEMYIVGDLGTSLAGAGRCEGLGYRLRVLR
jgi:hypothetical protein